MGPADGPPGAIPANRDLATQQGYRMCAQIVRERAKNFYLGLRLTPEPKRSALFAVYAWMRAADDIADAPIDPARSDERLAEFRETTLTVLGGGFRRGAGASDLVWLAFIDTVNRFRLRTDEFIHTLDALELDIHADACVDRDDPSTIRPRFNTFEGLEQYCHAFQLTNILRDIRQDYEEGRVYIPESLLSEHGLNGLRLATWADPAACASCVRAVAEKAREFYDRSERLDEIIHPDGARPLWAMTRTYRAMLDRMTDSPSSVAQPDAMSLSTRAKLSILAGAMLRGRGEARRA